MAGVSLADASGIVSSHAPWTALCTGALQAVYGRASLSATTVYMQAKLEMFFDRHGNTSQSLQLTVAGKLPISLHPHSVVHPSTATGTPLTVSVSWAVTILLTPCGFPPG